MTLVTLQDIKALYPCWSHSRLEARVTQPVSYADILNAEDVSIADRRWLLTQLAARTSKGRKVLVLWAAECARSVLHLIPPGEYYDVSSAAIEAAVKCAHAPTDENRAAAHAAASAAYAADYTYPTAHTAHTAHAAASAADSAAAYATAATLATAAAYASYWATAAVDAHAAASAADSARVAYPAAHAAASTTDAAYPARVAYAAASTAYAAAHAAYAAARVAYAAAHAAASVATSVQLQLLAFALEVL